MKKTFLTLWAFLALSAPCLAQVPDWRGEVVLDSPEYRGARAHAPIPAEFHVRNETAYGLGLCVISSILCDGAYQGVPGLTSLKDSALWRAAKRQPGGYSPGKLEELLKRVMPGEKWFSWEGDGTDLVAEYSRRGYPVAATMNTGQQYGYAPIHHMISLIHLDDELACVVDNNDPGKYHWMPRAEYDRRFVDGSTGWGFVWLRPVRSVRSWLSWAAAGLLAMGTYCLLSRAGSGSRS